MAHSQKKRKKGAEAAQKRAALLDLLVRELETEEMELREEANDHERIADAIDTVVEHLNKKRGTH